MALTRVTIFYSSTGLDSREQTSISFLGNLGTAKYNDATVNVQMEKIGTVIANHLPEEGAVRDYVIANLDANGNVIPGESVREPMPLPGKWAVPSTERVAPDYMAMRFLKQSTGLGKTDGLLRFCFTTAELATYQKTKVPPARLAPAPGVAESNSNSFAKKLFVALNDGPFKPHITQKKLKNGARQDRPMATCRFADLTKSDVARVKSSATEDEASGARKQLSALAREAKTTLAGFDYAQAPAPNQADFNRIKAEAVALRADLAPKLLARAPLPKIFA